MIDAFGATAIVQRIEGQRLCACAVKPPSAPADANARLIEMHDGRVDDLLVHPVKERAQMEEMYFRGQCPWMVWDPERSGAASDAGSAAGLPPSAASA